MTSVGAERSTERRKEGGSQLELVVFSFMALLRSQHSLFAASKSLGEIISSRKCISRGARSARDSWSGKREGGGREGGTGREKEVVSLTSPQSLFSTRRMRAHEFPISRRMQK